MVRGLAPCGSSATLRLPHPAGRFSAGGTRCCMRPLPQPLFALGGFIPAILFQLRESSLIRSSVMLTLLKIAKVEAAEFCGLSMIATSKSLGWGQPPHPSRLWRGWEGTLSNPCDLNLLPAFVTSVVPTFLFLNCLLAISLQSGCNSERTYSLASTSPRIDLTSCLDWRD